MLVRNRNVSQTIMNITMQKYFHSAIALLLVSGMLAGCDAGDAGTAGRVQILLTDAPLDDVAEARVTIRRVELMGEAGVVLLSDMEQAFDLLALRDGVTAPLADLAVPPGAYHQLRIVVSEEATLHFTDGSTSRLKIPSGAQTGIKINLPAFEIDGDEDDVTVVVDFDASRSFVRAGNSGQYVFKPVLKIASLLENGDDRPVDTDVFAGTVSEIGIDHIVAGGTRFEVDADTRFDGVAGLAALALGADVEVTYAQRADGARVAVAIEVVPG